MTITPQVRLLFLLSLLMSVVVTAGLFFVLRAQFGTESAPAPTPAVQRPAQTPVTPSKPAAKPTAKPTVKPSVTKAATQPKPATKAQPTTQPKAAKPAVKKTPLIQAGLPPTLTKALQESRVVVAVLAVPGSQLDSTVLAEAKAGAKQAGVGFVSLDVLREKTGRALAAKLGVVETPTVVVYKRPGTVALRFQGLVDSDMVAQAAVSTLGR